MEATPDIKLFGKWSFDDVEVRLRPMHACCMGGPGHAQVSHGASNTLP